ncbi:MAG: CDP-diacylglycerol--serine O-phosphatidyltransferase [Pseudomonadales bacterium]
MSGQRDNVHHLHADDEHSSRTGLMRRRGIYLAPNLITTAALFAGFFAIVAAVNHNYTGAALAIFAAMLADTLDGRVARWTRTESEFGAQYDSLSDMVAFGVAPAFVAFFGGLSTLGQIGWVSSFVYMACAALRLARFNANHDNSFFQGLASPSAAAIIASAIWLWEAWSLGAPSPIAVGFGAAITILTGVLMVSNFAYYSPKLLNIKERVPFLALVAVVLGIAVVLVEPPLVLLLLFGGYALSGPTTYAYRRYRRGNLGKVDSSND